MGPFALSLEKLCLLGTEPPHLTMDGILFCVEMLPIIKQYADMLVKNMRKKSENGDPISMKE